MTEYETVAVTISYDENEPLDIDGRVVGVLNSTLGSRRATLLVEKPVTNDGGGAADSQGMMDFSDEEVGTITDTEVTVEGVTVEESFVDLSELDYRELQDLAKEHDIKANQSTEDLIAALEEEL